MNRCLDGLIKIAALAFGFSRRDAALWLMQSVRERERKMAGKGIGGEGFFSCQRCGAIRFQQREIRRTGVLIEKNRVLYFQPIRAVLYLSCAQCGAPVRESVVHSVRKISLFDWDLAD